MIGRARLSAFRIRIVVGALLVALMALVLLIASLRTMATLGMPRLSMSDEAHEACRAAPEAWRTLRVGTSQVHAFETPEDFDPTLQLAVGEVLLREHSGRPEYVTRHADDGPCAYTAVRLQLPIDVDGRILYAVPAGVLFAATAVGLATYAFTVMPLLRRIERIRGAAVEVGGNSYRSENDHVGDALAQIAEVLDTSHARIVSDRDALVAQHTALERYMAELAHDLRVPLASLLLALQEVEATPGASADPARRALQDANYVSALIENLHHAARLRHGLDPLQGKVDLCDVVRRLEVRFQTVGRVARVEVAASVPETSVVVRCTPELAQRALGNMIDNAVSHGGQHVAILLTTEGDRFTLVIIDDGDGLSEGVRASLAHRTFTDDAARPRGPGLGIAITNEIARRSGWSVTYDQAEGGGLEVRISGTCG